MPNTLDDAFTQLGHPEECYHPSKANLFAGLALLALTGVGGLVMIVVSLGIMAGEFQDLAQGAGRRTIAGLFAGGSGALACAAWLSTWLRKSSSFRLWFCPQGLVHSCQGNWRLYPWVEVAQITESIQGHLELPTITIHRKDGMEVSADGNNVGRFAKFKAALKSVSEQRQIPWNDLRDTKK